MNNSQTMAIEAAIELLSLTRGETAREHQSALVAMLKQANSGKELRSVATMQQAIAIEVEKLQSVLSQHNSIMQKIGKAHTSNKRHLAGRLSTEAVCLLGDRLTRTTSLLSRLADGRK